MKAIGSLLIVLALVAAVVPQFSDCESQGRALTLENGKTVAMKCHWTSEASLAVALPLFLVGGLAYFGKRKETLRALGLLGLVLGAFLIALPTVLIGVCSVPEMICNSIMRPTLIFTGALSVLGSAALLFMNLKNEPISTERPA